MEMSFFQFVHFLYFKDLLKIFFCVFCLDNSTNVYFHFREALWEIGGLDGRNGPRIVSVAKHAWETEFLGRRRGDVEAEFAQSREEQRLLKKQQRDTMERESFPREKNPIWKVLI